jgi:hypothetical protein
LFLEWIVQDERVAFLAEGTFLSIYLEYKDVGRDGKEG